MGTRVHEKDGTKFGCYKGEGRSVSVWPDDSQERHRASGKETHRLPDQCLDGVERANEEVCRTMSTLILMKD